MRVPTFERRARKRALRLGGCCARYGVRELLRDSERVPDSVVLLQERVCVVLVRARSRGRGDQVMGAHGTPTLSLLAGSLHPAQLRI